MIGTSCTPSAKMSQSIEMFCPVWPGGRSGVGCARTTPTAHSVTTTATARPARRILLSRFLVAWTDAHRNHLDRLHPAHRAARVHVDCRLLHLLERRRLDAPTSKGEL